MGQISRPCKLCVCVSSFVTMCSVERHKYSFKRHRAHGRKPTTLGALHKNSALKILKQDVVRALRTVCCSLQMPMQRVNHFPNNKQLHNKGIMGKNLNAIASILPGTTIHTSVDLALTCVPFQMILIFILGPSICPMKCLSLRLGAHRGDLRQRVVHGLTSLNRQIKSRDEALGSRLTL